MRNVIARLALTAAVTGIGFTPALVAAQTLPSPWTLVGSSPIEYAATIDRNVKRSGTASAHIVARVRETSGFIALSQTLRAEAYRGRRILISNYRRTRDLTGNGTYLYVNVAGPTPTGGAYANSVARAAKGTNIEWLLDTVSVLVPANAMHISFGSIVEGAGDVWIDDVDVRVVDAPADVTLNDRGFETTQQFVGQTSAPLLALARVASEREIDAMVAFARLTGYVRFFYPADTVLATNWAYFESEGIAAAERATTTDSLVRTLSNLFAKIAPEVRVYATKGPAPAVDFVKPTDTTGLAVAFWRHSGVGLPTATLPRQQNVYSSRRVVLPLTNGTLPAGANDPQAPLRVDLGAGVSAVIPVALWMQMPSDTAMRAAPPRAAGVQGLSVNHRPVRLAAVADLWMTMQHFYPYFDITKTDWARELRTGLARAAVDSLPSLFEITLKRMVASLRDGHGNVYRSAQSTGILPVTLRWVEGQVVIANVGDTTATAARRGDIVLSIDGTPVQQLVAEREAVISSATPQWARFNAVERLGWADAGTVRRLRVRSAGGSGAPIRDVTVTATPLRNSADMPKDLRPDKVAELQPGVMYVDMGRITDADFANALPRLMAATAIVFDLRGYPSFNTTALLPRLADTVIRSAHFESPITQLPDRSGITYRNGAWVLQPIKPRITAAAYFLTDGRAISYAESTMGVVEAHKLGEIVGAPTAGTNGNINPFRLPGGSTVVWTGMRVRKQDGSPHHGVGIQPTVPVEPTAKGIYEGRDEVLEKALDLIRQRAIRP